MEWQHILFLEEGEWEEELGCQVIGTWVKLLKRGSKCPKS
jgi:hypothetical protein